MHNFYRIKLIVILVISALGCSNSSSGSNSGSNGTFSEIAALSVLCDNTEGGPAVCNTSQNGKEALIGWTSDPCTSINWQNLAAIERTTLNCSFGFCSVDDSVSWRSQSTGEIIYEIGSDNRTAVAWLNIVDNGSADQSSPLSGDVVCCQAEATQNADTYANMQSDKCKLVP